MKRLLLLCSFVFALVAPNVFAQGTHADEVVLQFEIHKDGAVLGRPVLRMRIGHEATLAVNNVPTFTVSPSRPDAQTVMIVCEFKAADAKPILRMKLRGQEQNTAKVLIGNDSFELRAAVLPSK